MTVEVLLPISYLVSPGDSHVRVGVTVGVARDCGLAVVLGGEGGRHSSRDELGSVTVAVVMFGGVD